MVWLRRPEVALSKDEVSAGQDEVSVGQDDPSMGQNEANFAIWLEAVPDALVGVDQSNVIRFINHRTELLFGYDRRDLVGQPIATLVPEVQWKEHTPNRDGQFTDLAPGELGTDLDMTGLQRDGTEFPVEIRVSPIDTGEGFMVIAAVRDMTEVKKIRDHNHRLGRLAAILDYSDDAIISTTLDGLISSWNAGAEKMYGYSCEEAIDQSIRLIHPEDRYDEMDDMLSSIVRGQHINNRDTVRIRKDGTAIRVSLTASPVHAGSGGTDAEIVGASTLTHDVSHLTQAYETARSMLEASLDSLVSISPEGMITDVNEATVKVTGVPREQLIGTAFSDYFTEPDKANEIYQRVFAEGMTVDYPLTMRHRDGTLTEVLYNASVYHDTGGKVLGVFAAARDVTKQKQAQYARSLIEAGLDPVVTICTEGQITDVNEATVKVTGVPREHLIGTAFSDYFTDPDKANEVHQQVFAQGSVTDYPLTMRHRDGALTEVLYNAAVYRDADGNVLGVFAAARDVTQQKQVQAAMAQHAKEMDRLAELERFQRLTVGRELKMIELKKEIEFLKKYGPGDGGEQGVDR